MRTFTSHAETMRSHTLGVVLFAAAGEAGLEHVLEFVGCLPRLRCPVLVTARDVADDAFADLIDGRRVRRPGDDAPVNDAAIWILPSDRAVSVRDGRLCVADLPPNDPRPGALIGRLCYSIRSEYGSHAFIAVADEELAESPFLQLLANRGATVVSPVDIPGSTFVEHAPIPVVIDHLVARAGRHLQVVPS